VLKTKEIPRVYRFGKSLLVKTLICVCLFSGCYVLKQNSNHMEIPVWNAVETAVISGVDVRSSLEKIGTAIKNKENVFSAFEGFFLTLFTKPEEERTENEEVLPVVNAADLSTELLSFEMSLEELQDDTSAERFVLPGSTTDTTLNFPHTTPLYGAITSPFGYRNHPILQSRSFHTGIDIAASEGSPIGCFADGTVLQVGYNNVYGNFVLIGHSDNYRSFYGHSSKVLVKEGECVSIGQTIAKVGTTGLSTGPHLHFEVRRGEKRLDPALFVMPNS